MNVKQYCEKLNDLLSVNMFQDFSDNGLQVGDESREIKKAAFAVDACLASFEEAERQGADILVVHHGLFWGRTILVNGVHYRRIKNLLDNKLALYAVHLPLDANEQYGNNAQMALKLGLENLKAFSSYKGNLIGWYGELPKALTCEQIIEKLGIRRDEHNVCLKFGKEKNNTVGIVSGGAANDVQDAIDLGLDCFITGENSHQTYHLCEEEKINMLSLGHYETEVFGVKALMEYTKTKLGLDTCFVDIPTRL